jgi:hypothetical protein
VVFVLHCFGSRTDEGTNRGDRRVAVDHHCSVDVLGQLLTTLVADPPEVNLDPGERLGRHRVTT